MPNLDQLRKHYRVAPDKDYLPDTENGHKKILERRLDSLRKIATKINAPHILDKINGINQIADYKVKEIEKLLFDFIHSMKQPTPLFEIKAIPKAKNLLDILDNDSNEIR